MSVRVLTTRELNRALLARQLLLERSSLGLEQAVEQMGGIQAQYAPSAYVALWSRVEGFQRDALTTALEERRLVQGTLMRVTIHIVSRADYWPLALAIREARRQWWQRVNKASDAGEQRAAATRLRVLLADGPLREADIAVAFGKEAWKRSSGVTLWLDVVRAPPSGTWERRRADILAAAEDWLGPAQVDPDDALDLLVRRYLGAFGPAPAAAIADWAGMAVSAIAPALGRLELSRFRDEAGKELLDVPGAPLPDADTPAPVRFLPTWDAMLLVHARRTQILPERYRALVFHTKTPHSFSTFLVDGGVAGRWRYEAGRVRLDPFEKLTRASLRALEEEGERLAAFHA